MMSRPRAPGPELRGASHHPELALATQAQFATAPWHELAVESGRRVWRDRSTNLAVDSFQQAWSAKLCSSSPQEAICRGDAAVNNGYLRSAAIALVVN